MVAGTDGHCLPAIGRAAALHDSAAASRCAVANDVASLATVGLFLEDVQSVAG